MSPAAETRTLPTTVDRAEVLRMLGYRRGRGPSRRVEARLDALWDEGIARVDARGAYRWVDRAAADELGMPRPGARVALALCTAGPALEREARRRGAAGALLDELLLDAIGSAAAEGAADALDRAICVELRADGLHAAPRVSPGYGRWDVDRQPALLARLPAAALGVTLTSGGMMRPRKSVSFAVAGRSTPRTRGGSRCVGCARADCAHRVERTEPARRRDG